MSFDGKYHGVTVITGWILAFLMSGCFGAEFAAEELDLTGPELTGVILVNGGEEWPIADGRALDITGELILQFSEPIDAASAEDAIVVVPDDLGRPCTVDLACGDGHCIAGSCQTIIASEAWLRDLKSPPLSSSKRGKTVPINVRTDNSGMELRLSFGRPLASGRRHWLLVSAAITDLANNQLELEDPEAPGLRFDLVTGSEDSGRPRWELISPPPLTTELPTNLSRLVIRFSRPIIAEKEPSVWLEDQRGQRISLAVELDGPGCSEAPSGRCAVLAPKRSLTPYTEYRLVIGQGFHDEQGRELFEETPSWIATGDAPDNQTPQLIRSQLTTADGCVLLRIDADEAVDLSVDAGLGQGAFESLAQQQHQLAWTVEAEGMRHLDLKLTDLAGNATLHRLSTEVEKQPRVSISELLINPLGPEPAQEWIEIVNLDAVAIDLSGFRIGDGGSFEQGLDLPTIVLEPAQVGLIVGPKFDPGSVRDVPPDPAATLIRLEKNIGLANRGDAIQLWDPAGRLVSSYGGYFDMSKASDGGRSVERIPIDACDLAHSWTERAAVESSPGR